MVLITLDSKQSDFEIHFKDPIKCKPHDEIGLISSSVWYSWFNISALYENNKLRYFLNEWLEITFPDGNYDAENLNNHIQDVTGLYGDECPVRFDVNTATNSFIMILDDGVQVDMTKGKLCELLGFTPIVYTDKINYATKIGNITRGVDRLLIHCSLVSNSYQNNQASDILYSFCPTGPPGSLIMVQPYQPIYLPIRGLDYIYSIAIRVTDQLNRPISFNGETLTFVLSVRNKERE